MNLSPTPLLAQQDPSSPMGFMVPMILMIVMMYFLFVRPQQKRQKELQKQIDSMRVGDTVVTVGGMHGMVANKGDKTVTLKVADNVRVKFDLASIARVQPKAKGDEGGEEAPAIGDGTEKA